MAVREGLEFENPVESDSAPLAEPVLGLLSAGIDVHCLRDLTRGGLASALNEIAEAAGVAITIDERSIPVLDEVQGACESLGLDPLYVANEGRFVAFVPRPQAARALEALQKYPAGAGAALIGEVSEGEAAASSCRVSLRSKIGVCRVVDRLSGEQLPRIC